MSQNRTGSAWFLLGHCCAGASYALISVCVLDHYDGAIGRTAHLWLALLIYFACAVIGAIAWWSMAKLMMGPGRRRGPKWIVAVLSGVVSMLSLVMFSPADGDLLAWLALCVFVPATLGLVWTAVSGAAASQPRDTVEEGTH